MSVLYAPLTYLDAREDQLDKACNGCGTKGLGGFLVPDTLYGLSISECCNIHDWMYHEGRDIKDKESADRVFLNNMVRKINKVDHWFNKRFNSFRRIRAKNYYRVVRDFGGPAFWADKN